MVEIERRGQKAKEEEVLEETEKVYEAEGKSIKNNSPE